VQVECKDSAQLSLTFCDDGHGTIEIKENLLEF